MPKYRRVVLAVVATVKLFADAAVASTGAGAGDFRKSEGGQKEFGSRESAA